MLRKPDFWCHSLYAIVKLELQGGRKPFQASLLPFLELTFELTASVVGLLRFPATIDSRRGIRQGAQDLAALATEELLSSRNLWLPS
jgi:hypothetical protein